MSSIKIIITESIVINKGSDDQFKGYSCHKSLKQYKNESNKIKSKLREWKRGEKVPLPLIGTGTSTIKNNIRIINKDY